MATTTTIGNVVTAVVNNIAKIKTAIGNATTSAAGLMSNTDKSKLDNIKGGYLAMHMGSSHIRFYVEELTFTNGVATITTASVFGTSVKYAGGIAVNDGDVRYWVSKPADDLQINCSDSSRSGKYWVTTILVGSNQ